MALGGCTLDKSELVEQLERYRRLGQMALSVREQELGLLIWFDADVDSNLLRDTLAIERGCCSFFTLDYDASGRRLSIAIDDVAWVGALRALKRALRDGAPAAAGVRWSQ